MFSLWKLLQLCLLWDKSRMARAGACYWSRLVYVAGFSHWLQGITLCPMYPLAQGHITVTQGQPLRLGRAADLHLWLASSDKHLIISLTQMAFNLLCHGQGNQALNLESCRRSTRSPLPICRVCEWRKCKCTWCCDLIAAVQLFLKQNPGHWSCKMLWIQGQ